MKNKSLPNEQLAILLSEYISNVSEKEKIFHYKEDFQIEGEKKEGVTYGKIARAKDGKLFLIKKNGRIQDFDKVDDEVIGFKKTPSRNTVLPNQYRDSSEEVCAARIFDYIKNEPNYLPQISLCTSSFTARKEKPYNTPKVNSGLGKLYVASEIIGNESDVNLNRKNINLETINSTGKQLSVPRFERENTSLIDDICENAVIMMILMNYDLKLDNFVISEKGVIPIDFGNARYEEKTNPDIISAIDEIRNSSAKNTSNRFSSKSLKDKFIDKQTESTKKFYRENLKPKHFLTIIEKIEKDPNFAKNITDITQTYSFGTQEDKRIHADVILARSESLIALKSVFLELDERQKDYEANSNANSSTIKSGKKVKNFSNSNLRSEVSKNENFEKIITEISSESTITLFYKFINNVIDTNLQFVKEITDIDKQIKEEPENPDLKEKLSFIRTEFNQYIIELRGSLEERIRNLENSYSECHYFLTTSWQEEKDNIMSCFNSIIDTVEQPFFKSTNEKSNIDFDESLLDFGEAEVDLEEISKFLTEEKKTMNIKTAELVTHLISFEILNKIRENSLQIQEETDQAYETSGKLSGGIKASQLNSYKKVSSEKSIVK